ncbi:MAG: hypothetical protein GY861_24195 [bacterium]|nr:hypothetical protein [bacterium]
MAIQDNWDLLGADEKEHLSHSDWFERMYKQMPNFSDNVFNNEWFDKAFEVPIPERPVGIVMHSKMKSDDMMDAFVAVNMSSGITLDDKDDEARLVFDQDMWFMIDEMPDCPWCEGKIGRFDRCCKCGIHTILEDK